jgi:hypothetical protein
MFKGAIWRRNRRWGKGAKADRNACLTTVGLDFELVSLAQ